MQEFSCWQAIAASSFHKPMTSAFWCNGGLYLPSHPSDPQHCTPVPAFGWPISRDRTSWWLTYSSLPSDSATHQSLVYMPDCKDYNVHQGSLHARRQRSIKATICRSSGVAGMTPEDPRYPALSRALCRTCKAFLKISGMALEQRLMGGLTRTHRSYRQSVFVWDIREMKPMDPDCRTKCTVHALLTQPYGAPAQMWCWKCSYVPEVNHMFEDNSALASISCWTSCFALWLMKV